MAKVLVLIGIATVFPALASAQAAAVRPPATLVVGSPNSPDIQLLPIDARPALSQHLEPVADRLRNAPENIAVLGGECPDGWAPRTTADGKKLYVPLGLLVDESGTPRTSFTLLVACAKP